MIVFYFVLNWAMKIFGGLKMLMELRTRLFLAFMRMARMRRSMIHIVESFFQIKHCIAGILLGWILSWKVGKIWLIEWRGPNQEQSSAISGFLAAKICALLIILRPCLILLKNYLSIST